MNQRFHHCKLRTLLLISVYIFSTGYLRSQSTDSQNIDELKAKILGKLSNFTFGLYIDTYYNASLGNPDDTSNLVPYSANCPIQDQIRMNVAAFEFIYSAEKVRSKLVLQYGDQPNLLAAPEAQFIKTLRQANFGFRIAPKLWIDLGYMFNPVGYESSWAVLNQISTVTIGGYFEPGSVLGAKVTYTINDRITVGMMAGNPYSLAYGQNTNMTGMMFFNYQPLKNLKFVYNNFFGNQALKKATIENNLLYNNVILTWAPFKLLELATQFDFSFQTNSKMAPDTNKTAGMYSGFIQARYPFAEKFSITARYEFFNDRHGFLTGINTLTNRGIKTNGLTASFEYKPVKYFYLRMAYRYLEGYKGSKLFDSNTSDVMQALIFSAGFRF